LASGRDSAARGCELLTKPQALGESAHQAEDGISEKRDFYASSAGDDWLSVLLRV
jgi:hypothetical protein